MSKKRRNRVEYVVRLTFWNGNIFHYERTHEYKKAKKGFEEAIKSPWVWRADILEEHIDDEIIKTFKKKEDDKPIPRLQVEF